MLACKAVADSNMRPINKNLAHTKALISANAHGAKLIPSACRMAALNAARAVLQLLREDRHAELSTRPIYHSAELLANWTV